MDKKRRDFIWQSSIAVAGASAFGFSSCKQGAKETKKEPISESIVSASPLFMISLAQWSLNKAHFGGKMTALDFAKTAKQDFGINAVEYVNQFFPDKAKDKTYLSDLKTRADGEGVESLLLMIDHEGSMGLIDEKERKKSVEKHFKWVEAAKFLGCHSIRVNSYGEGPAEEVSASAVQSLSELSTFAKDFDINVLVENHGGISSDAAWLVDIIEKVNLPNCGTLPDFGNFCIEEVDNKCIKEYDRYKGVKEMMPFAKAVSAKANAFNDAGQETKTDYKKMMQIVLDAGYHGYVGVEYEGENEAQGIIATRKLLESIREELKG
ncbi:MAG: sugar phosphate isomerase/epimerase [Saprospiraceae bacterium]|nr:sugar phosphate isomerase/epimerase [Saprospiraceae bacterium]